MSVADRMYARALYNAALDAGKVKEVQAEVGAVASAMSELPQLRSMVGNPQLGASSKAALLEAAVGEPSELTSELPPSRCRQGPRWIDRRDPWRVRADRRARGGAAHGRADDGVRAVGHRCDRDRPAHRARLGPPRRCSTQGRPRPDRRHRSPGRIAACGCKRARPSRTHEARPTHEEMT